MIKINYKALLKALSSLFLPTLSVCVFIFFLVLDLNKLYNIVFGSAWYSIILRLIVLILEGVLFYQIYNYYLKKDVMSDVIRAVDDPKSYTDKLKHKERVKIIKDRWNDYKITEGNQQNFWDSLVIEKSVNNNINIYEITNNTEITDIKNSDDAVLDVKKTKFQYFLIKTTID